MQATVDFFARNWEAIATIIGLVGGGGAAGLLFQFMSNRRSDFEAVNSSYVQLVDDLEERVEVLEKKDKQKQTIIDQLRVEIDRQRVKIAHYEEGIGILINQLWKRGIRPAWTPDKHKDKTADNTDNKRRL